MQENPLNKTELVLFDLDGTLIDTAPDFLISLNNVLLDNNKHYLELADIRHISQTEAESLSRLDLVLMKVILSLRH